MRYARSGELNGFRESLRAVACDRAGAWYLAGDENIRVFGVGGAALGHWSTSRPAWSLAIGPDGRVWAGEPGRLEVFSSEGRLEATWDEEELLGFVTALAVTPEEVLVADARSRWIHRVDHRRRLLNHIGDRHRKGGFHIPNGILDFALDRDRTVVVANPGMHRVERYALDGGSLGHFGRFGQQDPAGFPGCCNPTNLALGPGGEIVVSEKADPRVKVYDREGRLLTIVAGAEEFDPACKNMDLAVDHQGRIGVVDPEALALVLYEPVESTA